MNPTIPHISQPAQNHRGVFLGVSAVGTVICLVMALVNPAQFWPGYLTAANYCLSISLGCLGIMLIHGVTRGRWGFALGRSLTAGANTLPLILLLSAIVGLGAGYAFPWAEPDLEHRAVLLNKNQMVYLDPMMVLVRYVVMALTWIASAWYIRRNYILEAGDRSRRPSQGFTGFLLLMFFLTVGCATIDFVMALTPSWASSIYPLIRLLNCAISAMALMVLARLVHTNEPHHHQNDLTHDAGNWLQAFNMLWTYLAISQYILIWGADMPAETQWYVDRQHSFMGSTVAVLLFLFHWVVPFTLLLYRPLKKSTKLLSSVAILLLVMCFVDVAWVVLPNYRDDGGMMKTANFMSLFSAIAGVAAIGGLWLFEFSRQYAKLPDMIVKDLHHGAHDHDHAHDHTAIHAGEAT